MGRLRRSGGRNRGSREGEGRFVEPVQGAGERGLLPAVHFLLQAVELHDLALPGLHGVEALILFFRSILLQFAHRIRQNAVLPQTHPAPPILKPHNLALPRLHRIEPHVFRHFSALPTYLLLHFPLRIVELRDRSLPRLDLVHSLSL